MSYQFGRLGLRAIAAVAAAVCALALAEVATRLVDGFGLRSLALTQTHRPIASGSNQGKWVDWRQATGYASRVPLAPGVDARWFDLDPPAPPPTSVDPDLNPRYWTAHGGELPPVYEWNSRFVASVLCRGDRSTHPYLAHQLESLRDLYVFDPIGGTPYPTYRFLRDTHYPSGLRTNSFGWRGPDVPLNKPPGRIRIAFVGASTTVDAHGDPFSYPEYIGRWLTEWARGRSQPISFDVVNAGREGILSTSIAAVVRDEVIPVRPDLVVYYEGANQFWPNDFTNRPVVRMLQTLQPGNVLDRYSAIAVRIHNWVEQPASGLEPSKPPLTVRWPRDLDEADPPLDDSRLPVQLPLIVRDLDRIRTDLGPVHAALMLSSFVALVDPGLALIPGRDDIAFRELNERYWPFSYAHMRRFFDFENRVFRKYARTYGLPFNDIDAEYPRDPRLFVDVVHMTAAGVKLKAWIVFQHLVAEIDRRIQDGRLPNADAGGRTIHPAFAGPRRRLESIATLKQRCD